MLISAFPLSTRDMFEFVHRQFIRMVRQFAFCVALAHDPLRRSLIEYFTMWRSSCCTFPSRRRPFSAPPRSVRPKFADFDTVFDIAQRGRAHDFSPSMPAPIIRRWCGHTGSSALAATVTLVTGRCLPRVVGAMT